WEGRCGGGGGWWGWRKGRRGKWIREELAIIRPPRHNLWICPCLCCIALCLRLNCEGSHLCVYMNTEWMRFPPPGKIFNVSQASVHYSFCYTLTPYDQLQPHAIAKSGFYIKFPLAMHTLKPPAALAQH